MEQVFLSFLNRSIAAGWLVLALVLLRPALKKVPKAVRCLLWGLVGVRLVCPFSPESALSLVPSAEAVPRTALTRPAPQIDTGLALFNSTVNGYLDSRFREAAPPAGQAQSIAAVLAWVWIAGAALMGLWALASWLRLRRRVAAAVPDGGGVWLCDSIASPFLLGLLRPRIYLPAGLDGRSREYVLAHERAHIRRRDHWVKPAGFLLLAAYWFNPLLWLAYVLLCRDIELACDEQVIREMGAESKKPYSQALLRCSVHRGMIAACPLAFGEVGVKERVKNVLSYRRPGFWVMLASLALCAVAAVCFLTDPVGFRLDLEANPIEAASALDFRDGAEGSWALSAAQLEELASRLSQLPGLRSSDAFEGLTPLYQLSLRLEDGSLVHVSGYNWEGTQVDLTAEKRRYRINDRDFAAYLGRVCAGADAVRADLADAPGMGASDGPPVYAGGALLYQSPFLSSYFSSSVYTSVMEDGDTLRIVDSDGSLSRYALEETVHYWPEDLYDDETGFVNLAQEEAYFGRKLIPEDAERITRRTYLSEEPNADGVYGREAVWEVDLQSGGKRMWIGGTGRLFALVNPREQFQFFANVAALWTCDPQLPTAIPVRFEMDATVSAGSGALALDPKSEAWTEGPLAVEAGQTVYWRPAAPGEALAAEAALHYSFPSKMLSSASTVSDSISLRPAMDYEGIYGGRTYGISQDWLGLASSRFHETYVRMDGQTGALVISNRSLNAGGEPAGPSSDWGGSILGGELTQDFVTWDAEAGE